jgi:hypothetical protein
MVIHRSSQFKVGVVGELVGVGNFEVEHDAEGTGAEWSYFLVRHTEELHKMESVELPVAVVPHFGQYFKADGFGLLFGQAKLVEAEIGLQRRGYNVKGVKRIVEKVVGAGFVANAATGGGLNNQGRVVGYTDVIQQFLQTNDGVYFKKPGLASLWPRSFSRVAQSSM